MSQQTITLTGPCGTEPVTVPVRPRCNREANCIDLIVETAVHVGAPVKVLLSVRTDGTVHFWQTRFDGSDNTYAHIVERMNGYDRGPPEPTEAQRRTIARWWAGIERPLGLRGGVGASVLQWAFAGMDPEEVSRRYLDSKPVYLA